MTDDKKTKVFTPECTLIFPHICEPDTREFKNKIGQMQKSDNKYKCTLILNPDLSKGILNECASLAKKVFNALLKDIKHPFKKGDDRLEKMDDERREKYLEVFGGNLIVTPKSTFKPVAFKKIGGKVITINSDDELPNGCKVVVSMILAPYDSPSVGRGITAYLDKVMKISDGTKLNLGGSSVMIDDEFNKYNTECIENIDEIASEIGADVESITDDVPF